MAHLLGILLFTFLAAPTSYAEEDFLERVYRGTYRLFAGDTCPVSRAPVTGVKPECMQTESQPGVDSISDVLETSFYNQLAEMDLSRSACAINKQKSLLSQKDAAQAVLTRVNERLPYLSELRKKINLLTGENQLLNGKIGSRENGMYGNLQNEGKSRLIAEYDQRNDLIKDLMAEYERVLAELPGSDLPAVRSVIESRYEGKFSGLKLFDDKDFAEMGALALRKMEEAHRQLRDKNRPPSSHFSLSFDDKTRLAGDSDLIAELTQKNPQSAEAIQRFQCLALQRSKGSQLVMAGTLILPLGSVGLMKAAEAAYAMRRAGVAKGLVLGSRALGWAAVGAGAYQGVTEVYRKCFKEETASGGAACSVTLQSVVREHSAFDCVAASLVAGANVVGGAAMTKLSGTLAKSFEGKSKAVNDFIATSKLRGPQGRDLAAASKLDDTQRVQAARGLLDPKRTWSRAQEDAVIEAHNVGAGFGKYTAEDMAKKEDILQRAGFGFRERKILLGKGVTGQEAVGTGSGIEGVAKRVAEAKAGLPKGKEAAELESRLKPVDQRLAEIQTEFDKVGDSKKVMYLANSKDTDPKVKKNLNALFAERLELSQVRNGLQSERQYYVARSALAKQEGQRAAFQIRAEELGQTRRALKEVEGLVENVIERSATANSALDEALDVIRRARQTGMDVSGAIQKASRDYGKKFATLKPAKDDTPQRAFQVAGSERTAANDFLERAIKQLELREGTYKRDGLTSDWVHYQEYSDAQLAREMAETVQGEFSGNMKDLLRRIERIRAASVKDDVSLEKLEEMVKLGGSNSSTAPQELRGMDFSFRPNR